MIVRWRTRGVVISISVLLLAALGTGAWTWSQSNGAAGSSATTTSNPPPSTSAKLSVPRDSVAQDGQFLSEVTEADPSLATYEKKEGDVALRSLLTDGSAFCAFLRRDGNIDGAMVSVAEGAQQDESTTHLPESITTFNAVDAVALLTLCPSLEKIVPRTDLAKIRALGASLSATAP